jgi:hypothetical protein
MCSTKNQAKVHTFVFYDSYVNFLKQGTALSPYIVNFASECLGRKVQEKEIGLKLNRTY